MVGDVHTFLYPGLYRRISSVVDGIQKQIFDLDFATFSWLDHAA